ncbi:unnamed protein product [Phaedon cochleariae]|uniref:Uncharacterized protein n=1 Tax=Phaedon cochleariae TaxID=80249 RepID=A0A9N9X3J3_PHACE|nr:unnamed protein product [Phaedon cochleariae]
MKNITLGNQIANIIFTCFNIKRLKENGTTGNAEKKASEKKNFTITSLGQTYHVDYEEAMTLVTASATAAGLELKKFDTRSKENWYGTAAPYLDFFVGNALRVTELRIGHNMPIKKEGDASTTFAVSKYGMNGSHHSLLEGCTYPPEKRGSMAQSLGPMTALLCHIKSEEKYMKK